MASNYCVFQMAAANKRRFETFKDKMSLVRVFECDKTGHKLPCLANFVCPGPEVADRCVVVFKMD